MKLGAEAILGTIIAGLLLAAGSMIVNNSNASVKNSTKINSMIKHLDVHEERIMKRFDRIEEKLNGN